ncbi:MarR family winged helix-turn-helix transcriptional regulator [Magnetofaba australis]|uniref:Putative MarR family transcriptional regulator n=1 Tax=Magnetofaba australis IT-1 TaxID=1434232 RepID=A0A1Y2K0N5_9PROT|nr:MarR family winged helix-turn-helix transcriptional regulator [Magnetofaba australis]OSM01522.1 putative MarR family transcriptional regulator [Magnetofaba australis IT-1]
MFDQCLYFNVNALSRSINRIWDREYQDAVQLSAAHAYLIWVVLGEPGMPQRRIAQQLGLARSTVTRFVDALVKKGLVRRQQAEHDGREQLVFPTAQAEAIRAPLEDLHHKLSERVSDILGSDAVANSVTQLRQTRAKLESSQTA